MPQKKKAKTKKQMKKSINSLYETLQKEKLHHKKATEHCGRMKHSLIVQSSVVTALSEEVTALHTQLDDACYAKQVTVEAMADLVSNLK